jgi:septal ring factor EnvC (AmiA/AmiB activator)
MTALQELANIRGELDRIKADSDLNAQQFTEAQNALAAVTASRDALAAEKSEIVSERDALAAKVAALEKAAHDFTASVEIRAAALAVEQLAAVGVAPLAGLVQPNETREAVLSAYGSADAKGKRDIFLKHREIFSIK